MSLVLGDPLTLALQRFPGASDSRGNYAYARRRLVFLSMPVMVVGLLGALVTRSSWFVVAAALWGLGLASMSMSSVAWLMWQRTWRYTAAIAVSTSVRTAILVVLVVNDFNIYVAIGAAGLSTVLAGILLGPRTSRTERASSTAPWPRGFGIALAFGSLGLAVLMNFDRAVAPSVVSEAHSGTYAAMATLASLVAGSALISIRTVIYPRVVALWDVSRGRSLRIAELTLAASLVGGIVIALAWTVVPDAILDLTTPRSLQSRPLLFWLSLGYSLFAFGQYGTWWYSLELRAGVVRNRTLASAGVGALAMLVGAATLDGCGLAIGACVGMAAYGAILCWKTAVQRFALAGAVTFVLSAAVTLGIEGIAAGWTRVAGTFAVLCLAAAASAMLLRVIRDLSTAKGAGT